MAYTTVKDWCTGIADAIREKDGTTDPIARQDFPARISAISTGDAVGILTVNNHIDGISSDYLSAEYSYKDDSAVLYLDNLEEFSTTGMQMIGFVIETVNGSYYSTEYIYTYNKNTGKYKTLRASSVQSIQLSALIVNEIVSNPISKISISIGDGEIVVIYTGTPSKIESVPFTSDILINSVDLDYILDGGRSRMYMYKYIDFSNCTSAQYFMNGCKIDEKGQKITSVDTTILNLAGAKIDNFNYSFNGLTNCTSLILPPEGFNARATNYMFGGFAGTKIENLDKMGDDTGSNATNDHRNMFRGAKILEADLSGMTGRVASLNMCQNMFYQTPVRKIWIPSTWKNISCNSQGYSMVNGISNADCIIFTDAPSMPSTWSGLWYYRTATVPVTIAFGSTHDEYEAY